MSTWNLFGKNKKHLVPNQNPRKTFAQNIARTNFSINTINFISVTNLQIQIHRPIRFEHQDGPNTILWNIWHPCWCFQVWVMKSGNPFPTCLFDGTRSHPPKLLTCEKSPKISRFRYFWRKKKHHFRAKKNTQKLKILDFLRKMTNLGHFFLQNRSPVLPGSCPVFARVLTGSCPVLPGSARFSSSFWGFFNYWGFFLSVFDLDLRKSQKIRKFSIGRKKSAKFRNFRSECEKSENSESCTNFSGLGQQNPENSRP